MKKLFYTIALCTISLTCYAQLNFTLRGTIPMTNHLPLSNICGWTDGSGNEYALVGHADGISIVDVNDPDNPVELFMVAGQQSNWREIKTWLNYAYVTNETGDGLQIIDMIGLPASYQVKQWYGNGAIAGQLQTIHALHIDGGYAYLYGSNIDNGEGLIIDLSDPWNPDFVSQTPSTAQYDYIHDGYVRNDTMWAGHIYNGIFSVIDVTNKATPVVVATQSTPGNFTHNTWLESTGSRLFTTDEVNNSFLTEYDVSDVSNITELDRTQSQNPNSGSIVHNTHIKDDYAVTSWYTDGVCIHDVSRPGNMVLVGYYDTYPQGGGGGFDGCWGVYPYFASGTVVCSDMDNGLVVLTPAYVRGCYLEGIVTDSVTGLPINAATVTVLTTIVTESTKANGEYKTGTPAAGTYSVQCSKPGYVTKTISGVVLTNGVLTQLDIQLVPVQTFSMTGQVVETISGNGVPNAQVLFNDGMGGVFSTTADPSGNFTVNGFYSGVYDVSAGQWGYVTKCLTGQSISGPGLIIQLDIGWYDDFTFDFGWTVSGTASTGLWERGIPNGTSCQGTPANPGADVTNDCADQAYVTDNTGTGCSDQDVDAGTSILESPVFDLSTAINPVLNYSRWFFNLQGFGGPANDSLKIFLDNGTSIVMIEEVTSASPNSSQWVNLSYLITPFITPTSTMKVIVYTADQANSGNALEGGFDKFFISESGVGIAEFDAGNISALPNPFNQEIIFSFDLVYPNSVLTVTDVTGRVIEKTQVSKRSGELKLGNNWDNGIYFVTVSAPSGIQKSIKVIKSN